jgi:hypothetical protein
MAYVHLAMCLTAACSLVQGQDIVAFHSNGMLAWTNSTTNLFYGIEWAPTLGTSNAWHSDYSGLFDICSTNPIITAAVPMFYRVRGSSNRLIHPAPVPITGLKNSYATGDDGDLQRGVAWPPPRFIDNSNGTVIDSLTGLIWLRDANAFGSRTWASALTDCATLNSGEHGLTDASLEGDWRLPNVRELLSVVDYSTNRPALPAGHPFQNVQALRYWTSTRDVLYANAAWYVRIFYGDSGSDYLTSSTYYVWPVRGGH